MKVDSAEPQGPLNAEGSSSSSNEPERPQNIDTIHSLKIVCSHGFAIHLPFIMISPRNRFVFPSRARVEPERFQELILNLHSSRLIHKTLLYILAQTHQILGMHQRRNLSCNLPNLPRSHRSPKIRVCCLSSQ